ncbi:MAG: hypothetical protein CMA72_07475 [Euryarchaeota archaeon]|nr:hypothetical protein [Euryarchaeota archaeon]
MQKTQLVAAISTVSPAPCPDETQLSIIAVFAAVITILLEGHKRTDPNTKGDGIRQFFLAPLLSKLNIDPFIVLQVFASATCVSALAAIATKCVFKPFRLGYFLLNGLVGRWIIASAFNILIPGNVCSGLHAGCGAIITNMEVIFGSTKASLVIHF